MSRIEEALKRASQGVVADRGVLGPGPTTLEQYSGEGAPPPPEAVEETSSPLDRLRVTIERPALRPQLHGVDPETSGKLVGVAGRANMWAEQYRSLAATLHEAQVERGVKTILVTSSVPREGKTLTVVNLALTLSESYARRVLVIDADLRWPSVHRFLGVPNDAGLSEALLSQRRQLSLVEVTPLLTVLPAGRPAPNPLAGLSSTRMPTLLAACASRFDWVLVDAPPVGILPDAQLLARLAQGVLFVIGAGSTPFPLVERAIAELGRDCIIGTVLNGVDERQVPDSTYYSHYRRSADSAV